MSSFTKLDTQKKKRANDIDLKGIIRVIKKRLWIIIVIAIITTGLGAYYGQKNNTPIYQASSRIIIEAPTENRNTLQVIIKDTAVLDKVVKELDLPQSPEELSGQITVGSIENSQVVSISVTDKDPERAAEIANTTARVFKEVIPTIMEFNGVRLLSDAKVNSWPINQKGDRWPLIGLIAGIVIGVGFIFLLDSLDDSLRTENEIEEILELPVLGRVPKQSKRNLNKRVNKEVRLEARGETSGFN